MRVSAIMIMCLLIADTIVACQCGHVDDKFHYDRAEAVLVATVVEVEDLWTPARKAAYFLREKYAELTAQYGTPELRPRDTGKRVTFRVQEAYKRSTPEKVILVTGRGGGDCGCPMEVGRTYLVYVSPSNRDWYDFSICNGTSPIETAGSRLVSVRSLGPKQPLLPAAASRGFVASILAVTLAIVTAVAIFVVHKQK